MRTNLFILFIVSLCSCSVVRSTGQPGKPVVYAMDLQSLQKNKSKIQAGDAVATKSYKQLLKDADKALAFGPVSVMEKKSIPPSGDRHDYMSLAPYHWPDPSKADGLPYIRKDGQTNPEVKEYKDKDYMPKLCEMVSSLALAYYFSQENKYAEHATKLVRVWFLDTATRMNPNLNFSQAIKGVNTGRGAGLIDARHFIKMIDGIGLLSDSKYWTSNDQVGMRKWCSDFLVWMQTSKNGVDELNADNNHGVWYDALRLELALYTENTALANQVVASTKERLNVQMDEQGRFPKEMERTTSFHYTTFALEAFFLVAQMAEKTGVDLWNYTSPSGKSLRKGMDELKPYLMQEKPWHGQQIKDFDFEEGYPLLMAASVQYACVKCKAAVRMIAGDKADAIRANLLY